MDDLLTISVFCKPVNCSWESDDYQKDPTDPDIAGIGVLLSFFVPSVLATIVFTIAFFSRSMPDRQFNDFDNIILKKVYSLAKRPLRPRLADTAVTGYQRFILALNDQILLTSLGLFVTIYSQICSISSFSFHIAVSVAYLCFTIYLATLTCLRMHFRYNSTPLQRLIRIVLMLLSMAFLIISELLQYLTYTHDPRMLAACEIHYFQEDLGYALWDWAALAMTQCAAVYEGVTNKVAGDSLVIRRRHLIPAGSEEDEDDEQDILAIHPLVLAIIRQVYSAPRYQQALEDMIAQREGDYAAKVAEENLTLITLLDAPRDRYLQKIVLLFRMAFMIMFDLWLEIDTSILDDCLQSIFWLAMAIRDVVGQLQNSGVDPSPLMEWKFGQVMPVILLFAYAISAADIKSDRDRDRVKNESSSSAVQLLRARDSTTSIEDQEDSDTDEMPNLSRSARLPIAGSLNGVLTVTKDLTKTSILEIARQERGKPYTSILLGFAVVLRLGFLLILFFYFTMTVTVLTGVYILWFVAQLGAAIVAVQKRLRT